MNKKRTIVASLGMLALAALVVTAVAQTKTGSAPAGESAMPCCEKTAALDKVVTSAGAVPADPGPEAVVLPDRGKKVPLGEGWFVYDFDKKPAMGSVIARVEVFGKDGKPDTSLKVTGNVDMPSMRGMHGSGDVLFQLNQKGVYLLPMSIVMPGEWELALSFARDGKVVYRGYHRFRV
jgi:hypothetical protein